MTDDTLRETLAQGLDEHGVPPSLHAGILRYCLEHVKTGSFLEACFSGDFEEAAKRADRQNGPRLMAIGLFIVGCAPAGCHGSPAKVAAWLAREDVPNETELIADAADVAEGAPVAPAATRAQGNLPPDAEDVDGPRHPGGEEVDV